MTEKLRKLQQSNVDTENLSQHSKYTLSLSIGISRYDPTCSAKVEDLIAKADALMYDQKQKRKKQSLMDDLRA